jgi:hypothetical protein
MAALELVSGYTIAPGATETVMTACTGNTFTIRASDTAALIKLLTFWGANEAAGIVKVRSPRMHDNVQGLRLQGLITPSFGRLPEYGLQRLYAQDGLVVTGSGVATANHVVAANMLIYYDHLPGADGRFIGLSELMNRSINVMTAYVTVTGATTGDYSAAVAINSTVDLLKANTDYAILGYCTSVDCIAVRIQGPDIGNLGLGGPGLISMGWDTSKWFITLTEKTGLSLIPVINSANKSGTLISTQMTNAGGSPIVQFFLSELT